MKKFLALIALSLSTSLVSFTAAAHGPSPLKVDKSVTIKAEPAKVWALVKDFGNLQKWHPNITATKLEKKGEVGYELHLNYAARARKTPDYPGEQPPHHVVRVDRKSVV